MNKKVKKRMKAILKQIKSPRVTYAIVALASTITFICTCLGPLPEFLDRFKRAKIEVIRQSVQDLDDRIMVEYAVVNSGTGIANDIVVELQTSKGDAVSMIWGGANEVTSEGNDWKISIPSLQPGAAAQIMVVSENVALFREVKRAQGQLPNLIPANIYNTRYREGKPQDVVYRDADELLSYARQQR